MRKRIGRRWRRSVGMAVLTEVKKRNMANVVDETAMFDGEGFLIKDCLHLCGLDVDVDGGGPKRVMAI